ncbi:LADA_0H04434g1_1 [Lachancea dasiensis]|uniref:LADA_0H04434g1_1 n=1 Tax=Lachancea dasiensis TaxID=1072105 RepID=A0A1G4K0P7_9SACH|nr:LADA_0H04434g1_1 [Lachancea dasiensis]
MEIHTSERHRTDFQRSKVMNATNSRGDLNILTGLDVGFLRDNGEWVTQVESIAWDNIVSLDSLVKSTEQLVLKYSSPNEVIKKSIQKVFENVLTRYPLFFGYWKRFTAVQYQLNGLESSIEVLSRAVDAFPHSLDLWCAYLNVLMANNADRVDQIRINFEIARDFVGFQFLSHPFWDKYIEFETAQGQIDKLAAIYQAISRIPLHQYSKYYTAYKEFAQSNSSKLQIDDDIDQVFSITQQLVNSVWKFESQISQSYFNLGPLAQKELDNWDQYLNFAIDSELVSNQLTKCIFQRCLIPCRYYEHFWVRFCSWMERNDEKASCLEVYQQGVQVLPTDVRKLRQNYLSFLKESLRIGNQNLLEVYVLAMAEYSGLYPTETSFIKDFLMIIKQREFASSLSQSDQEILAQQVAFSAYLEKNVRMFLRQQEDGDERLQNLLNDSTLPIIVVELIKSSYLILKNNLQTKAYFTEFGKLPQMKFSTTFWLTHYKFLKATVDINGLEEFVTKLGTEIKIPTTIINDIVGDFKSFFLTNVGISDYEREVSGGRYKMGLDPLVDLEFKINNPLWSKQGLGALKRDNRDNGHPGLYLDKPVISNTIVECQSKDLVDKPPPLPTFRNLEKVNKAAVHKDFFSTDYLYQT